MSDQYVELEAALDRVVEAARAHLTAVKVAQGRIDDDQVWQAYVHLNNTSFAYDEQLLDTFGEVTPWDVESIDPDEADQRFGLNVGGLDGAPAEDAYPQVISVRQRRDYRVPSVGALLRVAQAARQSLVPEDAEREQVETVGEAVMELLQAGDGSLATLDVPELEPLDGLLTVTEADKPLDLEAFEDSDGAGPFAPAEGDHLVGRLDEHPFPPEDLDDAEPGPA
ncbi:hypothetical protein [Mangrovihabitans endophyticus]|uniref:Uncharacterized protein n=1 Tax=Mangrovihabitans endophyticus TaxID=1751298 RepID=A0A8J3FPT0_9ACTN|nr:hypothetical protein [Mangrovihabitans endophyticus]GGL03815.1 hypothetical protein GCM10012284_43010 [Mangrovihabitans endophyticus]